MKKCAICNAEVKRVLVKETYEYKGKTLEIKEMPVFRCTKCGEEFIDEESTGQIDARLDKLYRQCEAQ